MVFFHRAPVFFRPSSNHLTPYSLGGGQKVYFYQPTSEESAPPSDQLARKSSGELVEQNEQTGSSVIYQDRNVHIEDKGDSYTFSLDLPGIKSSDAKVEIRDGVLRVEAERKFGNKGSSKHIQHFLLKENCIDTDKLEANLSSGVLTITIPKKPDAKPHVIPVVAEYPPEATDDVKEVRLAHDLPGVKVSDLKLELQDGTIALHAERQYGDRVATIDKHFYVDETKVDSSEFKAFLMDGVLTITGYRKDPPAPKTITVAGETTATTHLTTEASKENQIVVETVTDEK